LKYKDFLTEENVVKNSLIKAAVVSSIVLASGCASMFNGSSQQVSIRSNVDGAMLYVNEGFIGKESGVTTFKKKKDYHIVARKDGCTDSSVQASKSFDATTLLGVLIDFGVITVLLVDGVGTGAWQQFDQTSYVLDPVCSA
tara:strand:+ start:11868 stop:12290 length:423 start_codon:yes stop_codon:yes gene_type:complete